MKGSRFMTAPTSEGIDEHERDAPGPADLAFPEIQPTNPDPEMVLVDISVDLVGPAHCPVNTARIPADLKKCQDGAESVIVGLVRLIGGEDEQGVQKEGIDAVPVSFVVELACSRQKCRESSGGLRGVVGGAFFR